MDKDAVIRIVKKYLDSAISGQEIENSKIDFKRKWYDLGSKPGLNEFLKDSTAIANTLDYEHRIFVRKGTNTRVASKYDLELMIYDRKNIIPDYLISIYISKLNFFGSNANKPHVKLGCIISFENFGKRPAAISDIELKIYFNEETPYEFYGYLVSLDLYGSETRRLLKEMNIVCKSNDISQHFIEFHPRQQLTFDHVDILNLAKRNLSKITVQVKMNNGKTIVQDANIIK